MGRLRGRAVSAWQKPMTRPLFARLLRPTVWLTAERGLSEAISLGLFAIQAPLLGPAAFGLVAAAMVFVAFWEGVPAGAMNEALLSVREIDARHFSSVTAAAIALCLPFGAILFGLGAPMAAAFGARELAPIMHAMAVLPLIQAFSIAPLAAAQREMRFQTTSLRTIASLGAAGVVGIVLTLLGAGVWALVWQAIVQRVVAAIVLWAAAGQPFSLAFSRRHFAELRVFMLPIMLSRLVTWAAGQLPRLILGLFLGSADLGLFTLASRLNAIIHQVVISPKAFVARVDLRRFADQQDLLPPAVREMFGHLSILTFPACLGGAAIVPALFHTWLNASWAGAILPAQILLLACVPYVTFYGCTALLYALNLQNREVGVAALLSAGGLLGPLAGGRFGLLVACTVIAVLALAAVPLPIVVVQRNTCVVPRDILLPQAAPLLSSVAMAIAVYLLGHSLAASPPAVTLCLQLVFGAVCYGAGLAVLSLAFSSNGLAKRYLEFLPWKTRLS
jgi:O-antigen/teichoic acid export membrane protein